MLKMFYLLKFKCGNNSLAFKLWVWRLCVYTIFTLFERVHLKFHSWNVMHQCAHNISIIAFNYTNIQYTYYMYSVHHTGVPSPSASCSTRRTSNRVSIFILSFANFTVLNPTVRPNDYMYSYNSLVVAHILQNA